MTLVLLAIVALSLIAASALVNTDVERGSWNAACVTLVCILGVVALSLIALVCRLL